MAGRILLLTQWFEPEPTSKGLVFAREMMNHGFEVEVVTGFPNYPGGKLYDGYKVKFIQRELIDGVLITRVPLYPSHDGSTIKRVLNYTSFAASALFYCLFRAKKPDVIYSYHPPLTVGVVAVLIRFFRNVSVIYDIQDMWPDTLRSTGVLTNERVLNLIARVAKWVYKQADQLVVLSPGFKELLIERGEPAEKIEVIPNWCDESMLVYSSEKKLSGFPSGDKFIVLFAGNIGRAQALASVIEAALMFENKSSNIFPEVVFVFLGGGLEVDLLKQQVAAKNLNNVIFLPSVPMAEVAGYLHRADALLVHLKKDPLFEVTIPSKTQAYMAIGKPIIMGVAGDAADIIKSADCGTVIESENPSQLVDAIANLLRLSKKEREALGMNGRNYYFKYLSLKTGTKRFVDLFNKLSKY